MKAVPAIAVSSVLVTGASLASGEPTASETAASAPAAVQTTPAEKIPTPEAVAAQVLASVTGIRQTLEGVQNAANADKALETLKGIQEKIRENNRFITECIDRGALKPDELTDALDQLEKQGKKKDSSARRK